jgi:hypothetical protein
MNKSENNVKKTCIKCNKIVYILANKKICEKCKIAIDKKEIKRKEKVEKNKLSISASTLTSTFNKLVRTIYPSFCHSTGLPLPYEELVAAHFIQAEITVTRWDLRNVYPTSNYENRRNQLHVLFLSDRLLEYYGIDFHLFIKDAMVAKKTTPISSIERRNMYKVFAEGLNKAKELLLIQDNKERLLEQEKLRKEIILKTKKIM